MLEDITMYRLKVFYEVVNARSFSVAAENLDISQPAVSAHIRALENQTQVTLLQRGRTITLTEAGTFFYEYTNKTLKNNEEITQIIRKLRQGSTGRIALGTNATLARYVMPVALSDFKKNNPNIELLLSVGNNKHVFEMVVNREVDFGLILGKTVPSELMARTVLKTEMCIVVGANHPLANEVSVSTIELSKYPFIILSSYHQKIIETSLEFQGVTISDRLMVIEDAEGIKQILTFGVGVAALTKISISEELKSGSLKKVNLAGGHPFIDLRIVSRPDKPLTLIHKKFLRFLEKFIKHDIL